MFNFFQRDDLKSFDRSYQREQLIKTSRILIIDDEEPGLINDLKNIGFAVDFDSNGKELSKAESGIYDLLILDFRGVGTQFGDEEGLSILRHLKRVNPSLYILAYTSKAITSNQSDFYRLTDGTLPKDAGVQDTLEKVERALNDSKSITYQWKATLALLEIEEGSSEAKTLEKSLIKSFKKEDIKIIKNQVLQRIGDSITSTLLDKLIVKVFEHGVKAKLGIL